MLAFGNEAKTTLHTRTAPSPASWLGHHQALAVKSIVKGGFSYSGQRCTAVKLVVAVGRIAEPLAAAVAEGVGKLVVGMPEDDADITPVVSESSAAFIEGLVDDAREKGEQQHAGGEGRGPCRRTWDGEHLYGRSAHR